jgi:predicted DNA-binding antitoxin AbrB/MazE fold protein
MNKLEIKLKNGESLFISLNEDNLAEELTDVAAQIEEGIEDGLKFIEFKECFVNINEIVYVKPFEGGN